VPGSLFRARSTAVPWARRFLEPPLLLPDMSATRSASPSRPARDRCRWRAIAHAGREDFRKHISVVMQDDQLLSGSIADNICFFEKSFEREHVMYCAEPHARDHRTPPGDDRRGATPAGTARRRIARVAAEPARYRCRRARTARPFSLRGRRRFCVRITGRLSPFESVGGIAMLCTPSGASASRMARTELRHLCVTRPLRRLPLFKILLRNASWAPEPWRPTIRAVSSGC
jgi:hypothetical protein